MESPVSRGGSPIFVRTKWIKAHFSMSGITAVRCIGIPIWRPIHWAGHK